MKRLKIWVTALANALLLGLPVLIYVDGRNPFMSFLTSGPSKIYLLLLAALGFVSTWLYLLSLRDGK